MRKILLMICTVFTIINCNLVYATPDEFTLTQKKTDDKSFLEVFTEEEKCIILAFEHQLDIFGAYYRYHHTDMKETAGDIELWDVASLYWNSDTKTLNGFLEYIVAPSRPFISNMEYNEEAFKDKVWKDYGFVKETRIKGIEKKLEQQKDDELRAIILRIMKDILKDQKTKTMFKEMIKESGQW